MPNRRHKRSICAILLLTALFSTAHAQSLDSLYGVWKRESATHSDRIQAFSEYISQGFMRSKPDSAYLLTLELLNFAESHQDKKGIATAYNLQGSSWDARGNYPRALECFERGLETAERIQSRHQIAGALNNIGTVYNKLGYNDKALSYYERCLKIDEQQNDSSGIASSLHNIGMVYTELGDHITALRHYERSLNIQKAMGDVLSVSNTMNSIAGVYFRQGDLEKSLNYLERSRQVLESMGDLQGVAMVLSNIGAIHKNKKDYMLALQCFQEGMEISIKLTDPQSIAYMAIEIGLVHLDLEEFAKAVRHCTEGFILAETHELLYEQKNGCSCLYRAYKAQGNGNKALQYHELLTEIEDSLDLQEAARMLDRMEYAKALYTDSIANAEAARQMQIVHEEEVEKKNKTRNILIGSSLLLMLTAGGFFSRWRFVRRSRDLIAKEKERSESLLLNILPEEIAEELKQRGRAEARNYDQASILFTDFKEFTQTSEKLSASELVNEINDCFEAFDRIIDKYDIEKIKTIGDAYMAAGGIPVPSDNSVKNIVLAALEMQYFISRRKTEKDKKGEPAFEMRVGIHTGPVVAGIVGVKKFQYDIWGDTVNTASRMESSGEAGKVNISQSTYEMIKNDAYFTFESRGKIEAKGKGEMEMWFVSLSTSSQDL